MTRCNYCKREARIVIKWQSWISKMGHRRALTVSAAACPEHEACVNFVENRRLHPNALVQINPAVKP